MLNILSRTRSDRDIYHGRLVSLPYSGTIAAKFTNSRAPHVVFADRHAFLSPYSLQPPQTHKIEHGFHITSGRPVQMLLLRHHHGALPQCGNLCHSHLCPFRRYIATSYIKLVRTSPSASLPASCQSPTRHSTPPSCLLSLHHHINEFKIIQLVHAKRIKMLLCLHNYPFM